MTQTCPKCRHIRQPGEDAPDWQCPACGVAYAKAADAQRPAPLRTDVFIAKPDRSVPWGKWVAAAVLAYGAWTGYQVSAKHRMAGGDDAMQASSSSSSSEADLQALAHKVRSGDVTIFTTTTCPYCAQAKGWMSQYGFAYSECNVETSMDCARQMESLGGVGVPFLEVKGKAMKNGFDSDEFVALLKS
jgi:glutaredoxin